MVFGILILELSHTRWMTLTSYMILIKPSRAKCTFEMVQELIKEAKARFYLTLG